MDNNGATSQEIEDILNEFKERDLCAPHPNNIYRSNELWDDPKWVEEYNAYIDYAAQFDKTLENKDMTKFVREQAKKMSKDSNTSKEVDVCSSSNESSSIHTPLPNTQNILDNVGVDADDILK